MTHEKQTQKPRDNNEEIKNGVYYQIFEYHRSFYTRMSIYLLNARDYGEVIVRIRLVWRSM